MIAREWIEDARQRLAGQIVQTPLTFDPQLNIYLKWENRQKTGSFKIRGALNKVLGLARPAIERGLVTASAGNHGQGVGVAANMQRAPLRVFASNHAVPAKLAAMRALGAEVCLVAGGYAEAEKAAIADAANGARTWISPYNDAQVIAGQATLGLDLLDAFAGGQDMPAVVAPAGGGGLVAGIGLAVQYASIPARAHAANVIAAQSDASPYLYELYHHRSQDVVSERDSLADGLAGAVEPGSMTIDLARSVIDQFVLVTEEEIARAIAFAWVHYGEVIEGSAAAALAAVLFGHVTERPVVVVISGGNIQPELHEAICKQWAPSWKDEGQL